MFCIFVYFFAVLGDGLIPVFGRTRAHLRNYC